MWGECAKSTQTVAAALKAFFPSSTLICSYVEGHDALRGPAIITYKESRTESVDFHIAKFSNWLSYFASGEDSR